MTPNRLIYYDYIKIYRGIDLSSDSLLRSEFRKNPMKGVFIVPERGQTGFEIKFDVNYGRIHKIIRNISLSEYDDAKIIDIFTKSYPRYNEEDDPVIEFETSDFVAGLNKDLDELLSPYKKGVILSDGDVVVSGVPLPFWSAGDEKAIKELLKRR